MTIALGDILRITCNFQLDAVEEYVNVYHFQWAGVDGQDDLIAMGQIRDDLEAAYQIVNVDMANNLSYIDVQGQNITQNTLLPTVLWLILVNGASTNDMLPLQVAAPLFFRTTRPKTRASKFLAAYTVNAVLESGNISASVVARLQSFGDKAVAGFTVVVNHLTYGAYNRPLNRFTPVNAAIIPSQFGTQKRRKRGIGS